MTAQNRVGAHAGVARGVDTPDPENALQANAGHTWRPSMTQPEHDAAVRTAFARLSLALSALDEHRTREAKLEEDVKSAEAELRALARRKP